MTYQHPQTTLKSGIMGNERSRDVWGSIQSWGGGTCERACLSWPIVHECFSFLPVTPAPGVRIPPDMLSLSTRNVFLVLCCYSVVSSVWPVKHRITEAAAPCKGSEMVQILENVISFFFCLLNHVRSIYQTQFEFILIREWKDGWEIHENVSPLLSCQSPVTLWSRKMSCWLKALQIMIPHAHRHTCTQVCHLGTSRYLICFIFTISSLFNAFLHIVFQIKGTSSRFMGTLQVPDTWAGCL